MQTAVRVRRWPAAARADGGNPPRRSLVAGGGTQDHSCRRRHPRVESPLPRDTPPAGATRCRRPSRRTRRRPGRRGPGRRWPASCPSPRQASLDRLGRIVQAAVGDRVKHRRLGRLEVSRFGPTLPTALAAASVWHTRAVLAEQLRPSASADVELDPAHLGARLGVVADDHQQRQRDAETDVDDDHDRLSTDRPSHPGSRRSAHRPAEPAAKRPGRTGQGDAQPRRRRIVPTASMRPGPYRARPEMGRRSTRRARRRRSGTGGGGERAAVIAGAPRRSSSPAARRPGSRRPAPPRRGRSCSASPRRTCSSSIEKSLICATRSVGGGDRVDPVDQDVDRAPGRGEPLELALHQQQRLGAHHQAMALVDLRRDDQVDHPELVLEQDEDNAAGRPRALAGDDQAPHPHPRRRGRARPGHGW